MGQTKFKILNRSGYSIHWNNSWESKKNYKKNFINFLFLELFLDKVFNDSLFVQDYFFIKKKNTLKNNFSSQNIIFLKKLNVFKNNFKSLKIYNSKIWILKYQNWVIINVYIYVVKNIDIGINSVKKKKFFTSMINMLIIQINLIFYNIFFEGWKIF